MFGKIGASSILMSLLFFVASCETILPLTINKSTMSSLSSSMSAGEAKDLIVKAFGTQFLKKMRDIFYGVKTVGNKHAFVWTTNPDNKYACRALVAFSFPLTAPVKFSKGNRYYIEIPFTKYFVGVENCQQGDGFSGAAIDLSEEDFEIPGCSTIYQVWAGGGGCKKECKLSFKTQEDAEMAVAAFCRVFREVMGSVCQ